MPYPTPSQIHSIFTLLSNPANTDEFFTHVHPNVIWTVKGACFLSGRWTSKTSYRQATFDVLPTLLEPPGIKLKIAGGESGIIVGQDGWATVELETFDTYTRSGVKYEQTYAWHVRFDDGGLIVEAKIWTDTLTLERVLGGEKALQLREGGEAGEL